jgi:hypothetical protein
MAIFELLDRYLLDGSPEKAEVVQALLDARAGGASAQAFYDGMRLLGPRTPDLSLVALRLVLAGKKADDAAVVRLRTAMEEARRGEPGAREEYRRELEPD